jgi:aryl sulfotransferase
MLLHFNDLKADMPGTIGKIAAFLDISIDEAVWPRILEHCTFAYMKAHAATTVPKGGAFWEGGPEVFLHSGKNGRWRDVLSAEECEAYDRRALAELGPECARWLETGVR